MLYLVVINGLIDSFNPCAVGVLLLYAALLISMQVRRSYLLAFGLFYLIAIYTTYFFIGLGFLRVFHLFGIHNFFGWLAAIVILILGVFYLKEYFRPGWRIPVLSPLFSRCHIPKYQKEVSIASGIILGFLVGLCEFPCSGGIYLATIALLSAKETFLRGISYLLIYNLMFILPLVVIFLVAMNSRVFVQIRKWHGQSTQIIKLLMAITMLVSGILLINWLV